MKPLKWKLMLLLMLTSGLASGCLDREVYLKPGQVVEVAKPAKVTVWVLNAKTGKREKRLLRAQAGFAVGRRKAQ